MLGAELSAFLATGCGLLVGTVSASGEPFAGRGWGLDVGEDGVGRVLVSAVEFAGLGYDRGSPVGAMVAVTGCDVRTLRSAQVKGPILAVEPVCVADTERSARYCDEFFAAIGSVDDIPRALLDRMVPSALAVCTFSITEAYDQTPGPGAGAPLAAAR